MKKYIVLLLLAGLSLQAAAQSEQDQIHSVFESYKDVITEGDGQKALELVDQNTIRYYHDILMMALSAQKATLAEASFMDQMLVLYLRHSLPPETLRSLTGETLFTYAVENKMVGTNITSIDIGKATIAGNKATASLVMNEKETPLSIQFVNEGGEWKFDVTSVLYMAEASLQGAWEASNQSKTDFINAFLKVALQLDDMEPLWEPVGM